MSTHGEPKIEIHVIIISWRGQHQKAAAIEAAVRPRADYTSVVYSDPESEVTDLEQKQRWHEISAEFFYGMKHKTALDLHSKTPNAVMLQIQADNEVDDVEREWAAIVERAREVFTLHPKTGAWMPNVLGLGWTRRKAQLGAATSDGLVPAMLLDPSCWAIHPEVLSMTNDADYVSNKFGWGTGWLVNLRALSNGYSVYWDANLKIVQPKTAGYSHDEALVQAKEFLKTLTKRERFVKKQIQQILRLRRKRKLTSQNALVLRARVRLLQLFLKLT